MAQEVEGSERALQTDAAVYAKLYKVSQAEAERRVQLMVLSRGALEADEAAEGDDLAASYFTHDGEFAFVIESRKGQKPKKLKTFKGSSGDLTLPVEVRQSQKVSRKVLMRLLKDNKKSVFSIIPTAVEVAYKEIEGSLWVVVDDEKTSQDLSVQTAEIERIFKVPIKIERIKVASTLIAMPGGKVTYVKDVVLNGTQKYKNYCTTAFAATSSTGQLGMLTAGHCKNADGIFWSGTGQAVLCRCLLTISIRLGEIGPY